MTCRLLFLPSERQFYVVFDQQLYAVPRESDAYLLATAMPLRVEDGLATQHAPATGTAAVLASSDAEVELELRTLAGDSRSVALSLHESAFDVASWIYGGFPDNWVSLEAQLEVFTDEEVRLTILLPRREGAGNKKITIEYDGAAPVEMTVERGNVVRTPPLKMQSAGFNRITVRAAYAEPRRGSDMRKLGVLVPEVWIGRQVVKPSTH